MGQELCHSRNQSVAPPSPSGGNTPAHSHGSTLQAFNSALELKEEREVGVLLLLCLCMSLTSHCAFTVSETGRWEDDPVGKVLAVQT